MFDFGLLPPEINSARMYAGPGAGSLLAASAAWQQLAGELYAAAGSYGSVVSGLTSGPWAGPSATAMAAAAMPYVTWLSGTAAQAEQTGAQAGAAAAAHAAAFAATVPPPLIEANRSLLATLVATNLLGQNTPAIAATEALYAEMWAQDAAAMYGYAGASAAASRLTGFTPAPQTVNPTGQAGQAVAVAHSAAATAGIDTETLMSQGPQLISTTPQALAALAAPPTGEATGASGASLSSLTSLMMPLRMAMMPMSLLMRMLMGGANGAKGATAGLASAATPAAAAVSAAPVTLAGFTTGSTASAGLGRAVSIGALSVPPAWSGLGAPAGPAAGLPLTGAVPASAAGMGHPIIPPMMPMGGAAGRGGFGGSATSYDFRPTVVPRTPAAG